MSNDEALKYETNRFVAATSNVLVVKGIIVK